MPVGADPVAVGLEPMTELTVLWALVDTNAPFQDFTVVHVGTNALLCEPPQGMAWKYIGSAGINGGQRGLYVRHVFMAV
jgi:hypothetical protein